MERVVAVLALAAQLVAAIPFVAPGTARAEATEPALIPLAKLLAVEPAQATPSASPAPAAAPTTGGEVPPGLAEKPAEPVPTEAEVEETSKATIPEEEESVFRTWWFWVLAGGIVIGSVALGVMASDTDAVTPARSCMPGYHCFGDGR